MSTQAAPLRLLLAALVLIGDAGAAHALPPTLCEANEQVVFSCATASSKIISICASPDLQSKPEAGYLAYRFGRPGKVELKFPPNKADSTEQFEHYHYFRAGVDRTSLSFANRDATYEVFDNYDESEKPATSSGVDVKDRKSGRAVTLSCRGRTQSNWTAIEGVVPCSDEAINSCEQRP